MQAQSHNSVEIAADDSNRQRSVLGPVLSSLGWPLVIGLVAFWTLLFALEQGWIQSELLVRYLSAHPVSYVATAMFFVGAVGLLMKLMVVCYQIWDQPNVKLSPPPALAQRADASRQLLTELEEMPIHRQESYLGRRLIHALEFVDKTETANGLEEELKYLSDVDAEQQQESFALTRILIWAIPMLGFLGTVIGISGALGGLSVESDFNSMLSGLKEKLYVAFDTTALALTLSIVLMFAQFVVNKLETQLLNSVDETASEELIGRFVTFGTSRDPYLASVENMSERVLASISEISSQQSAVWDRGLESIQQTTESTLGKFAEVLADRLAKQLDPLMDEFGISIRAAINDSNSYLERYSHKIAEAMQSSAELLGQRNEELCGDLASFSGEVKSELREHAQSLQQVVESSSGETGKILAGHLQRIQEVMGQSVKLAEGQTEQLAVGIDNSQKLLHSNSVALKKSIELANQYMEKHTGQLHDVVMNSSQVMEEHARRISDAVTRSEEIVDKRQETIAQTQESMLKAQMQQSMAISSFTEKLKTLEEVVDQANSLEKVQSAMTQTIESLERSDTIANEIKGLARLVKEQIKSADQQQLAMAQSSESQLRAVISQTEKVFDENARLLNEYQLRTGELVEVLRGVQESDQDASNQSQQIQAELRDCLNTMSLQLVNQNQTLTSLGAQIKSSFDLESLSSQIADIVQNTSRGQDQSSRLMPKMEAIVQKLEEVQQAFEKPTKHQQQFLEQQKQTIENQSELLDFCQTLEVNNRSTFLDSAHKILEEHATAAAKAVKLEETVRDLTFSVNLLNQSMASQNSEAAKESLQFSQPEVPKRVA